MKSRAAVATLLLGFLCAGLQAQTGRRFAIYLHGGGAGHEENNIKAGFASGLGFGYRLSSKLSLFFETDYWTTHSRYSYRKLYNGTLQVIPVCAGLRYDFRPNGYFAPYAYAGLGYVFTDFRIGPILTYPELRVEQVVHNGWAGQFGLGAHLGFSSRWGFFSEIGYLVRNAPGRTIYRDMNLGERFDDIWINLHVVLMRFGFRFEF